MQNQISDQISIFLKILEYHINRVYESILGILGDMELASED